MQQVNHRNNLENLYNSNKSKLLDLEQMLQSLDKIELSIGRKIEMHQKYIEKLQRNFNQSIATYQNICKTIIQ